MTQSGFLSYLDPFCQLDLKSVENAIMTIKLDRELLPTDETDLIRISTYKYLVELIKQYDVKIVSEGIKTEFDSNFIKSLKVDYLQGYYLAKPEVI